MTGTADMEPTRATLTVFTDPFCTWSWGSEPILRRIEETYRGQVDIEFVTGGLVEDFETFHDGANGISEPADVAPHWREAADRHGMPVDAGIWHEDPPRSSYPPSIAYHAAKLVDEQLASEYLRRMREAFTAERRRIDDPDVLVELAREVGLDAGRFQAELDGDSARHAFHEDLKETRQRKAGVFPSFRVHHGDRSTLLRGFQPFGALAGALEEIAPAIDRSKPRPLSELFEHHGRVATREAEEVYALDRAEALERLAELEDSGRIRSVEAGTGRFWEPI